MLSGSTAKRVGVTAYELALQSLTPLSVGACGRLQLGVVSWTTLLASLQLVDS